MLFNSVDFAIFFFIVFTIYWLVSKKLKLRNLLILASSYFFYGWWDWRFLFLIVFSSFVDYSVGRLMNRVESKKSKKLLLFFSICINLGLLFYFKYTNFFIESFVSAFTLFGRSIEVSTLNIILPVGISFYTFQTLSYTIDIYRNKIEPTNDALSFFAFVSFFPQLVAGPIERASHLLPQFHKVHKFNYEAAKSGLLLIAFGLFKKLVIADRAAMIVNRVYDNPHNFEGVEIILATLLFAFQIYCDFSGYTDIAIGSARMMGFDLMKNFRSPYFSKSITEFWHRWHISLSTWFRDYVYIPLGGSRKGKYRTYLNLFIVFLVSGLWHGAAINFVIWGALHGTIIVFEKMTKIKRQTFYKRVGLDVKNFSNGLLFSFVTFLIVCFAWIFFRANTFQDAQTLIGQMSINNLNVLFTDQMFTLGLNRGNLIILLFSIIFLLLVDLLANKVNLYLFLYRQTAAFRWVTYIAIVLFIVIFGYYGNDDKSQFIYFQF